MRSFLQGLPQKIEVIMDYDEIAIYNSIPTAEGTIFYIMENTEHTIHSANIHIIGAGRCGETLAKSLRALGADVSISSRNPSLAARLFESGIPVVKTDEKALQEADVIINTVPALMLGHDQLRQVKRGVYIADIASTPGGVDFEFAQKLGIKAELLPALPGIVAPKTAASYLVQFIKRKVSEG
jgi:dipicolinate synthase subunit A